MTQKTLRTLLPFASYPQAENGGLENDSEKAAVFCLAELGRESGGGIFNRQPTEKIVFIAEVYYPFWIAPFRGMALLFDGLNVASHKIAYPAIPEPAVFKDNLNQSSSTRHAYVGFLSEHLNYFESANGEQTKVIDGLMYDKDFLTEFMNFLKEAITTDKPLSDSVLVAPAFDSGQIKTVLKNLEDSRSKLMQELEALNEIIKLLNTKTQQLMKSLREELEATETKFRGKIQKAKTTLENKKAQINKEYSKKVTEESSSFEQETVELHKEKIKLEKTKEDLNSEIDRIENEIKTSAVNKEQDNEQGWKEKRNELKDKIPGINDEIKNLDEKIQEIEENKRKALFQLKQENDAKRMEAGKDLMEIEASCDAEKKICKDEMEKIEELTSSISSKIDRLSKMRETVLTEFDGLGIREEIPSSSLVQMPFYLLCYQSKSNKRFTYVAASIISEGGLSAKLRAIGKKKITQMFQPRSQKITSILNSFIGLMDTNVAFSHDISEACSKANIVQSKEAVETIKSGLRKLNAEGWLSNTEFESFSQIRA